MNKTLYIRPARGLTIPYPSLAFPSASGTLPPFGDAVGDAPYWRRRLRDGDVETTTAEAIAEGKRLAAAAESAPTTETAVAPAPEAAPGNKRGK